MASVNSSSGAPGYRYVEDSSIDYPVVDRQSYSYVAEAVLGGGYSLNLRLVHVRIDYVYTAGLPLVSKE